MFLQSPIHQLNSQRVDTEPTALIRTASPVYSVDGLEIRPSHKSLDQVLSLPGPPHGADRRYLAQHGSAPSQTAEMVAAAAAQGHSILEYYARSMPLTAACHSIQKRCITAGCSKISVSRGLCRGHGGGRRCHFDGGCAKSAQSRSLFCWAHGGGQRCDVTGCMRSRKSKRFCVAHVHLDQQGGNRARQLYMSHPAVASSATNAAKESITAADAARLRMRVLQLPLHPQRSLPSIREALLRASRTAPTLPQRSVNECCL